MPPNITGSVPFWLELKKPGLALGRKPALTSFLAGLLLIQGSGNFDMESVAYILILALTLGLLFFAIAFREPPRIIK